MEAPVAAAHAEDTLGRVEVEQAFSHLAHHVVEPRAEAAAGDDCGAHLPGVEVERAARPGAQEDPRRRRHLVDAYDVGEHDVRALPSHASHLGGQGTWEAGSARSRQDEIQGSAWLVRGDIRECSLGACSKAGRG